MTFGLAGKQEPQWQRQAQHPLSHGLMRQDVVYQQGSAIRHSACAATGAETAPFAAKSDQFFIVAGFTADPEKTVLEHAAFQILVEFLCDVCG